MDEPLPTTDGQFLLNKDQLSFIHKNKEERIVIEFFSMEGQTNCEKN